MQSILLSFPTPPTTFWNSLYAESWRMKLYENRGLTGFCRRFLSITSIFDRVFCSKDRRLSAPIVQQSYACLFFYGLQTVIWTLSPVLIGSIFSLGWVMVVVLPPATMSRPWRS